MIAACDCCGGIKRDVRRVKIDGGLRELCSDCRDDLEVCE